MTKPMYQKYYKVWAEHAEKYGPRTALLYQVGGFFELYDTENLTTGSTQANIRAIAELCQLSLTTHAVEGATDLQTLFGGFPEHALGKFERILVQAGYTVVVVVQRKGAGGAVEDRVVDHIASPGCYVEGARDRRLVGCLLESLVDGPAALQRVYWAVAAIDIATGGIWFAEGADRDRLHQFLCMHPPAELVIWSDGLGASSSLATQLHSACAATHMRCLGPAAAAVDEVILDRFWPPARKRLEWLPREPQARRCLAAMMEFVAEHVPSVLPGIGLPTAWVPDGEVRLGNAALEQLGLLSLRSTDDKQSLLGLMDTCRSVAGRRLLRARLLRPITDIAELNRRLDRIDAVSGCAGDAVAATERGLRSLYDMSRLWRRLELGSATLGDMSCLLRSYEAARDLMVAWPSLTVADGVRRFLDWILSRWSVDTLVEDARASTGAPVVRLPWVSGYRSEAEALFAVGAGIRAEAEALRAAWSAKGRGEALYLDYAEGGGFRITGTKRRVAAVITALRDAGDTSATTTTYKASATVETATLIAISQRHRSWYLSWLDMWADVWADIQAEIVGRGRTIHGEIAAWCAELDVAWSIGRLSREWLWTRPVFVEADEGGLEVRKLRHPILERLTNVPYVAHSLAFQKEAVEGLTWSSRGLLLYGMNASGKSSLMKAIGLCVLLGQAGFPVPAASCRIAPFTAIFTRILGNDNLWAGLSSFAVEMTEFREILRFADGRSLVLGDELCSGTESLSATALVAAGVETLAARGSKFVFATHLHELATLPDIAGLAGVRAVHLKVHYDAATDRLVYDRTLAAGAGSALYGLEVCRALDLPAGYLERAMVLRSALAGEGAVRTSVYSTGAVVDRCGVCGSRDRLEMHHIRPQAEAAAAAAEGVSIHAAGNLVCLCAACHDDHHGGTLVIKGWEDTSAGRRLVWNRVDTVVAVYGSVGPSDEVIAWVREQRGRKIRVATIQRMAKQIFGCDLADKQIRSIR
jgi:DNA mismatch repair protein MutS